MTVLFTPVLFFVTHQTSPLLSRVLLSLVPPRNIETGLSLWRPLPLRPPTPTPILIITHLSELPQRLIVIQFPPSLFCSSSFPPFQILLAI